MKHAVGQQALHLFLHRHPVLGRLALCGLNGDHNIAQQAGGILWK